MIFNRAMETQARGELVRLQDERLQATVARLIDRVQFYRDSFQRKRLRASDARLENLSALPLTTKADLRARWPFGMLAVERSELLEIHASSGTTGAATMAAYAEADLEAWSEVMARTLALGGVKRGDLVQNAYGYGLFTGGLGFHYGAQRLGATVLPISAGQTARQLKMLEELGPSALLATPSYALHLGEALAEIGVGLDRLQLRHGLFGAEPWSNGMRQEIESRLGLRAIDCYGLSEVIGPGVAAECQDAQDGLHVQEDHFLAEILDVETQVPLGPETPGELVITTLTRHAAPVLRYRTGDITLIKDAPCRCGRTSRRIGKLTGRIDDMLVIRGVNIFPSQIETVLLSIPELEPQYRLIVERERALDTLDVEVEPRPPVPSGPAITELGRVVGRKLRDELGLAVRVRIVDRHSIPRSEGKALRVVDRRHL
jgi:phenylacetate-CoA ligase